MAYNIRILPTAEKELEEAIVYLLGYSKKAASDLMSEYENQINLLKEGTVSYALSRMPELAKLGYHTALVGNYLFLYYIEEKTLVIAHFFHQRQDYASLVLPNKMDT